MIAIFHEVLMVKGFHGAESEAILNDMHIESELIFFEEKDLSYI